MSNGQNVELLSDLLQKAAAAIEEERTPHPELTQLRLSGELRRKLVQHMIVSAGVLIPAALTDDDAVRIGADAAGNVPTDRAEIGLCVRQNLERIARGDA
jgi:sRNA-binding carbon storage regulator CsrA